MNTSVIHLRDTDEIEAFYLETTGMKPGYFQLSPGQAGLRMVVSELAGVTLIWTWGSGRIRWRDEMTGDGLHIGFAIECEGSILSRGRPIDRDQAQIWMPEREMDLIINGPYCSLDIGVDREWVEALGWSLGGTPLRKVPQHFLDRLIATCRRASEVKTGWSAQELRDQVLERLEPVIAPWRQPESAPELSKALASGPYRILKAADEILDKRSPAAPLRVDELAYSIGVPRRSLFHAYRRLLGVGPRRYFELTRLMELRSRLRSAASEHTVTTIANDLGFNDLGRMAARYRQQFGENPSDTLNRQP